MELGVKRQVFIKKQKATEIQTEENSRDVCRRVAPISVLLLTHEHDKCKNLTLKSV